MDTPDTIWINTADTAERTGSDQSRSPVVVDREYRADRDTVRLRAVRQGSVSDTGLYGHTRYDLDQYSGYSGVHWIGIDLDQYREYRADRDTVRLRAVRGSGAGK